MILIKIKIESRASLCCFCAEKVGIKKDTYKSYVYNWKFPKDIKFLDEETALSTRHITKAFTFGKAGFDVLNYYLKFNKIDETIINKIRRNVSKRVIIDDEEKFANKIIKAKTFDYSSFYQAILKQNRMPYKFLGEDKKSKNDIPIFENLLTGTLWFRQPKKAKFKTYWFSSKSYFKQMEKLQFDFDPKKFKLLILGGIGYTLTLDNNLIGEYIYFKAVEEMERVTELIKLQKGKIVKRYVDSITYVGKNININSKYKFNYIQGTSAFKDNDLFMINAGVYQFRGEIPRISGFVTSKAGFVESKNGEFIAFENFPCIKDVDLRVDPIEDLIVNDESKHKYKLKFNLIKEFEI